MKTKSFLLGAAALMLATACSNEEVVEVAPQSAAIGFSSFVNNSTRATDDQAFGSNNTPASLRVYGTLTKGNEGDEGYIAARQLFYDDTNDPEANLVTKSGNAWTYSPLRFWIEGGKYSFAAVAPASALAKAENATEALVKVTQGTDLTYGGITEISFTNDGETDLLYDVKDEITSASATQSAVSFTLGHLLSRVRFNFVNGMAKDYNLVISDVKITDAYASGTYNPAGGVDSKGAWTVEAQKANQTFEFPIVATQVPSGENVTSENKYFIAAGEKTHLATFTIELIDKSGNSIGSVTHENVEIPSINFTKGYTYTLKTIINSDNINPGDDDDPDYPKLKPIVFNVEVSDWNDSTPEVNVPVKKPAVSTED